ncbi:MAG: regulatory iron-sulfur-containing complex subunit RicT [Bacilli bacterium]|jgi:cell fate regulator YaaT (PSP1 superfamily)
MTNLLGVPFEFAGMHYYQTNKDVDLGTLVVCSTEHGTYLGRVAKLRKATDEEMAKPDFNNAFPFIDRVATFQDQSFEEESKNRESEITRTTQAQADKLQLSMKISNSYLAIDEDKVLITFTSEGRVDFRELVRILNGVFHLKIELRQIGPRDHARLVGGIGPCGLPLCCTTFLSAFDGISIAMAKNQLLAINIPKLSGQCGKLMCCLKFEDKAYAELRPLFPKMGEKFTYKNSNFTVTGLNVLTDTITAYNGDAYENFTREEFQRVKSGLTKTNPATVVAPKDINSGVDLSGNGIKDTNSRLDQIKKSEERHQAENKASINRNNNNNRNGNNHNNYHSNSNNNNNGNRSFGNNNNNRHSGYQSNRNNNYHSSNNYHNNNNTAPKKESGFIPVNQIADKSVLTVKGPVKDDKK